VCEYVDRERCAYLYVREKQSVCAELMAGTRCTLIRIVSLRGEESTSVRRFSRWGVGLKMLSQHFGSFGPFGSFDPRMSLCSVFCITG